MPAYTRNTDTETFSLPSNPAFEFQLKSRASYGDYSEAVKATYRVVPERAAAPVDWLAQFSVEAALLLVTDWNLTDEDDATLPITADTLRSLSRLDGDFLCAKAATRMEGRPVEEEAPFVNGSGKSSKATKSSRPRS